MSRVLSVIVFSFAICNIAFAQSGAIQSVEEIKALAFDKMFAYFEQMEEIKKSYIAACKEKLWAITDGRDKPYEADILSLFYTDAARKVEYAAVGRTVVGSRLSTVWNECVRRDGKVFKRDGQRAPHTFRGVIKEIDLDSKDANGYLLNLNMVNDAMTYPVVQRPSITVGQATLLHQSDFYLAKLDVYHAERLKNGNLVGFFAGRGTIAVIYVVEFAADCNDMPVSMKFIADQDKDAKFADMLTNGHLVALTESTWVQAGNFWVPKTVKMKNFGGSTKWLKLEELEYEFVWKVSDDSPTKSLTADSEDWMQPFFGLVINDDYTLRKGAQK